jgi:hypothetical protein
MVRAAALSGAFFLAGGAIPLVGGILLMLAPAPVILYAVGRPSPNLRATIAVLLATALVGFLWGPLGGIAYFVCFGMATAITCYMLERRYSFEMITAIGSGVMVAASVVTALVMLGGPDALIKTVHDTLAQGMARGQDFYKMLGMQQTMPADTEASVISLTMRLSPAFALLLAASTMLLNLRVFWRWAGPQRLTYSLFGDFSLVRGIIYFVVFAQPVVAALVSIAGIFDMWIDFRRLKPPSPEASNMGDFF